MGCLVICESTRARAFCMAASAFGAGLMLIFRSEKNASISLKESVAPSRVILLLPSGLRIVFLSFFMESPRQEQYTPTPIIAKTVYSTVAYRDGQRKRLVWRYTPAYTKAPHLESGATVWHDLR